MFLNRLISPDSISYIWAAPRRNNRPDRHKIIADIKNPINHGEGDSQDSPLPGNPATRSNLTLLSYWYGAMEVTRPTNGGK